MNPFKALMSLLDGFELLIFSVFIVILIFWGIPFELFQLFQQSKENHLWLFIIINALFIGLVLYSVRSLKLGKLSKANFCGNIVILQQMAFGQLLVSSHS